MIVIWKVGVKLTLRIFANLPSQPRQYVAAHGLLLSRGTRHGIEQERRVLAHVLHYLLPLLLTTHNPDRLDEFSAICCRLLLKDKVIYFLNVNKAVAQFLAGLKYFKAS